MAEGGVSVGSVSARPIHSPEEQMFKFPAQLLDSPCANSDLVKLNQSVGSVSARPIHSLEEQLSRFPAQLLDSPCANSDLVKLSQSVSEWQDLAPYMQLTLAEERGILTASPQVTPARQCSEMFRIWRERLGHNANYRYVLYTF